jgi:hypothetical protein
LNCKSGETFTRNRVPTIFCVKLPSSKRPTLRVPLNSTMKSDDGFDEAVAGNSSSVPE